MTRQSTDSRSRSRKRSPRKTASTRAVKRKTASKTITSKATAAKAAVTKANASKAVKELAANDGRGRKPLRDCAEQALRGYFSTINGHDVAGLYEFVLTEVEVPLLRTVLEHAGGNQTRAAEMLGINRGTLRKKMRQYRLDT
jgi:Fis family transcriptional regulator, factor for inversion stimulation protein